MTTASFEHARSDILSRLNFKYLTRVGCLSKRCREFFVQRGVHHKIQSFRFRWDLWVDDGDDDDDDDCDVYFQSRLREWIEIAVRCNVEVIHLVVIPNNTFRELPASLLHCKSLKSLTVDMICNISVVPSMDFSSNLECMRLKDVSIKNDGDRFLKWISGCCTSIKELLLEDCVGVNNLVIESSSLESFCSQSH
ncbi:hypothetical protein ACFX13_004393 [Malus domestica]